MKKSTKNVFVLTLAVFVVFSTVFFSSCRESVLSPSRVMVLGSLDEGVFSESIASLNMIDEKYQDGNIDQTRNFVLENGNIEELHYVQSRKNELRDLAVYSSKDENLSCYYDGKSDQLIQINAENGAITIPNHIINETDYRNWVERILSKYGVEDISNYRYSCQTNVVVSNEESTYQDRYMYFYSDIKSNEHISKRIFTYTKYIGDHPTTDRIEISIFALTGSVIIKFDEQKFHDTEKVTFDDSAITAVIESYIVDSINSEKYEFSSLSIRNKELTRIDTETCVSVEVEIELLTKENRMPLNTMVTLLVFME